MKTFTPACKQGVTVAVTTSSQAVAIDKKRTSRSVCVTNYGDNPVYVCFGDENVTATAEDSMILAPSQVSLSKNPDATHMAVIGVDVSNVHAIIGAGF